MIASKLIFFLFLVFSFSFVCFGQSTKNQNQDRVEQQQRSAEMQRQQRIYEQQIARELARTHPKSVGKARKNRKSKSYPSEKELAVIAPDAKYFQQYRDFLKKKNTGLTKLVSDVGCGVNARLVSADANCIAYGKIPGYGSTYSFRKNQYVLGRFADIVYKDGILYAFGNLTTGFFTEIGEVSIADVNNKTNGAKYTFSFVPKKNFKEIKEQNDKLVKGVISNGFAYQKATRLIEGKTYLLRSVAYRLKAKTVENGRTIVDSNTNYDRRRDVIVALRVVEIDEEGSVTLLWRVLKDNKAPRILFS